MTAAEYIFAVVMTVLIVWLVTEIPIAGSLKGPRSMQREMRNRRIGKGEKPADLPV